MTSVRDDIRGFISSNNSKALDLYLSRHQSTITSQGLFNSQNAHPFVHDCCTYNYPKCLQVLLKHGASPNLPSMVFQREQSSPLGMALGRLHLSCVKELLSYKAQISPEEFLRSLVVHNGFAALTDKNTIQESDINTLEACGLSFKTHRSALVVFKDTMRTADFERLTAPAWKILFQKYAQQNNILMRDMLAPSIRTHIDRLPYFIQTKMKTVFSECLAEEMHSLITQAMPTFSPSGPSKKM